MKIFFLFIDCFYQFSEFFDISLLDKANDVA